tara:strand:- start:1025 stop:1204 length:180 start_codon:yes stop_codon:yes gene_type:complete
MEVFCRNGLSLNTKAYKWHIFSGGGYPALEGRAALQAYASHVAGRRAISCCRMTVSRQC